MNLQPLFEWIQQTPLSAAIRSSAVVIAAIEGVHLVGLALLLGTILMVDMSLLGRGIRGISTSDIARALGRWTVAGLVVMLISGPLMFTSEAFRCYKTPAFWVKMVLLAVALVFHFSVHQRTALAEPPVAQRRSRLVGAASLVLWISIALAAKAIAIFPGNTEGRF